MLDKYGIKEEALLDSLMEYLMDNVFNLTSAGKISTFFKQNGYETNHMTIGNYIKYLCSAYMFYKVKRYDIRGKKYMETSDKYYLSDLGFRYAILSEQITLARELAPLQSIKDSYPKILIANTGHEEYDIDGIKILNLSDWMHKV